MERETLFLGTGGHITCSLLGCPSPCMVDQILTAPRPHEHIVTFAEKSFAVTHPLRERLTDMTECPLHDYLRSLDGPPCDPGRYRALTDSAGGWTFEAVV
jgi:hypothetical protein